MYILREDVTGASGQSHGERFLSLRVFSLL